MSSITERTSKKIDMVFVLALITLFTAASLALVLIGAKQYRIVTNDMTENHLNRTTSSYLAEKIRQNDAEGSITLCDLKGVTALSITSIQEDVPYITYIYFHENTLRELVVTENSVFSLSSGQAIIEMQGFELSMINDSLICAEVTDMSGTKQCLYFPLHSNVGKEES